MLALHRVLADAVLVLLVKYRLAPDLAARVAVNLKVRRQYRHLAPA